LETDTASVQQRLLERKGMLDRAQTDLESAQAAIRSIRSLGTEFTISTALRTETLQAAREKGVAEKIDALYNNALSAVKSGDLETAKTARLALQYTRDMLGRNTPCKSFLVRDRPAGSGAIRSTAALHATTT
jgi:hypothetical protein